MKESWSRYEMKRSEDVWWWHGQCREGERSKAEIVWTE